MCRDCSRRQSLAFLIGLPLAVAGCRRQSEGPEEIHYSREVCAMCGMVISDPRYAAEIRGGPDRMLVKFDDIGDAVNWLDMQSWRADPAVEFWVMDSVSGGEWLDARQAFYMPGTVSPMDYGFAAVKEKTEKTVDFATMSQQALARGMSGRCNPGETPQP